MASPATFAALTFLLLGDSHFASPGYMGTQLADLLTQDGARVVLEAACGAPSSVWVQGLSAPCGSGQRVEGGPFEHVNKENVPVPSFDSLVAKYHPNVVVVAFGDTMGGYSQPGGFSAPYVEAQVTALTRKIQMANIPCVWVGPGWGTEGGPYFKTYAKAQAISTFLSQHVAPCRYIDSLAFAKPGEWQTFDGQHYTLPYYTIWARDVNDELLKLARSK